jgi:hypothetical protein
MYISLHVKCPLLLFDLIINWNLMTYFSKISQYNISWKPIQWFSSCYRQRDRGMMKLTDIFLQIFITNAPNMTFLVSGLTNNGTDKDILYLIT